MRRAVVACVCVLFSAVGAALAQETTGDIIGTIISEDGQALPGVTVTVEAEGTGLRRAATCNAEGFYRFAALPPGRYTVTAGLDGFQAVSRAVKVELGRSMTNSMTMPLGAFTDTIEVSGDVPQIDPTSTVTGLTVNTDELNAKVPLVREATELALLAPGTISGSTDFNSGIGTFWDVRMYTPGQRLTAMRGASVAETGYQVNGLNITNFRNGLGSSRVPFEFLEEVQVKTGGWEAEFGRATGGVINMVTKSGTNTLRGAANAYFQPESLQEQMPNTPYNERAEERQERLEANASVGGAVVRDRLFYFLSASYTDEDLLTMGDDWGERWQSQAPYWGAKLDWNIAPSHRLEGTYFSDETNVDRTLLPYDQDEGFGDVINTGWFFRGGSNAIVKYSAMLSDSFMASAQYGINRFDRTDRSSGDECPQVRDEREWPVHRLGCWVSSEIGTDADQRDAYRLDLDLFVSRHSLRAGLDAEDNTSSHVETYSGGVYYRYYLNGTEEQEPEDYEFPDLPWDQELVRVRHWSEGGDYAVESRSAYLQDSWAARPNLTVNFGVRYEEFNNGNSVGESFERQRLARRRAVVRRRVVHLLRRH
jgi:hypothetical protein